MSFVHAAADDDRSKLPDLWWGTGVENNRVEVRATRPVEFRQATVRWYQAPLASSQACRPIVDLEVDGRVVATFEPESECTSPDGLGVCVQQTTRTWSETVRGETVRLIDRSRILIDGGRVNPDVCGVVQRIDLGDIPEPPQPRVIAHVGEMMHLLAIEGSGPGGYHFRVTGSGIFAVRPTGQPVRFTGAGVRALETANELVVVPIPGSSRSYIAATASTGTDGPRAHELYLADAAQPTHGLTRVHVFDPALDDLWYDRCEGVLMVTTDDHRQWRVPQTGSVQEVLPAADAGAP